MDLSRNVPCHLLLFTRVLKEKEQLEQVKVFSSDN